MKVGTILLNTSVPEKSILRKTVFLRKNNKFAECLCLDKNRIRLIQYLWNNVGEDKPIQPVGYIDIIDILQSNINKENNE